VSGAVSDFWQYSFFFSVSNVTGFSIFSSVIKNDFKDSFTHSLIRVVLFAIDLCENAT